MIFAFRNERQAAFGQEEMEGKGLFCRGHWTQGCSSEQQNICEGQLLSYKHPNTHGVSIFRAMLELCLCILCFPKQIVSFWEQSLLYVIKPIYVPCILHYCPDSAKVLSPFNK